MHVTSFSSISYCSNSEYWAQKHVQSGNIQFNSLPTFLILGEQDWDRASFQIKVSDLILLISEGRLRHASGPAHYNIESVTYIEDKVYDKSVYVTVLLV